MGSIVWAGEKVPLLDMEKITPAEVDAMERLTGMTFSKMQYRRSICVCEHGERRHINKDAAGDVVEDDTSCSECGCEEFDSDLPQKAAMAPIWLSVKRQHPTVTYDDVAAVPYADLRVEDTEPDPT